MTEVKSYTQANWYTQLLQRVTDIAQKFELEDNQQAELREFVVEVAREQYNTGNRSGISWLRKQQAKEATAS